MRKEDRTAIALLVLLLTLVFSDVLFFGQNFYFRDLTRFYYPAKKLMHDLVDSGSFPWWNPSVSAGQPLAANPEYELFYPPQWLIFLPDFDLGYRLHILIHFYIAAIGMFLLLRRGGLRIESALFGSISFALGGLLLSSVNLLPILFALAWVPWIALFGERWVRSGKPRHLAGAAIALAMQWLAGEPVSAAITLVLIAVFGMYLRCNAARLMAMGVSAFALAAVLIIPGFDFARDSVRSRPFSFEAASTWSAPPLKFAELLIPGALGSGSQHCLFYWGTAMEGWRDPFYISVYFGLLPLALAAGAMRARVRGWWVVLAVCAAAVLLSIGSHTPLFRMLHQIPVLGSIRYPEKFIAFGVIPLTIFAAIALDRAIGGDLRIVRTALVVSVAVAVAALALTIFSRLPAYAPAFVRFWHIEVHPLALQMARMSARTWIIDFLRAVVVCVLLIPALRNRTNWGWAAVLLLTFDLAIERPAVAESTDGALFTTPPPAARVLAPSDVRLFHQADWYTAAVVARRYLDLPGAYWTTRNGLFPNVGEAWGVRTAFDRDIDSTNLIPTADLLEAMWAVRERGRKDWVEIFAAMSNVGWRALYRPFDQAMAAAGGDSRRIEPIVFVPVNTNPRFYFAEQVVRCADDRQFIDLLTAGKWSRRAVFLDRPSFEPASGTVLGISESPNRIALRVRSAGRAVLVCSVTRHKDWKARLDGVPVPILAANLAYQALDVPAGEHRIVLTYRNRLIVWCGAVSLLALLSLLAAAAYDARGDRSERRSG